ncbi:ABC transporter permease [Halobellus salinisoli]|uniref:ABC transporter permease n=1 Tax=Halobellus salinisoli TaxID=3108500 RepID=UPI00300A6116
MIIDDLDQKFVAGLQEGRDRLENHYVIISIKGGLRVFLSERVTVVSLAILLGVIFVGVFGPMLTPYDYQTSHTDEDGELLRAEAPSADHLLGTNQQGQDVLSRLIYGARPTLITGFLGGTIILVTGLTIGVTAGYFGGLIESALMRFTDFVYGIPLIPTAIVIVAFFGIGFWKSILIIGGLLWRGNARVFRSQVLQIKERPYVRSAEALGGSSRYVIFKHILPNLGGMMVLFFALGIGVSILISASLSFLGVTSPFIPSWGVMLRNAYGSGLMTSAWWWALPPGFMISITVLTTFMLGRGYERVQKAKSEGVQV